MTEGTASDRETIRGKSPSAYRTIGEAAEETGVSARTLRDWETKFPEIDPLKRAGGRRYYSSGAIALIVAIRELTVERGLTARGVRKLLDEEGPAGVTAIVAAGGAAPLAGALLTDEDEPPEPEASTAEPAAQASRSIGSTGRARLSEALSTLERARARLRRARGVASEPSDG